MPGWSERLIPLQRWISGSVRSKKRLLLGIACLFVLWLTGYALYFYFSLPDVTFLIKENPKSTALMEYRKFRAAKEGRKLVIRQSWVSFRHVPELLRHCVRITEDASFYFHEGIDYNELQESIEKNLSEGKYVRGASTITQQLAKNLFLSTEKSLVRKLKEVVIARRLERTLGKNRIFHLYLNVIEFGDGIFGVQAASGVYFGKDVGRLTLEEMIRLTAVIPRPLTVHPNQKNRWLNWKCRWILSKLKLYGYITETQYEETLPAFR